MKLGVIYEPRGRAREYAALAANLYRGCGHRCSYCYGPQTLRMDTRTFHTPEQRKGALARLTKDAAALEAAGDERPILMSFSCDPYQPLEDELQVTRRAIEILKAAGRRVEILTKGGVRAVRDFDLLAPGDAYAATLTFSTAEASRRWEPEAADPASRVRALQLARERGLRTWASIEPVIEPAQSLALIEMTLGVVQLYKLGAWNYDAGAEKVDWIRYYHHARALIEGAGCEVFVKADLRQRVGQ